MEAGEGAQATDTGTAAAAVGSDLTAQVEQQEAAGLAAWLEAQSGGASEPNAEAPGETSADASTPAGDGEAANGSTAPASEDAAALASRTLEGELNEWRPWLDVLRQLRDQGVTPEGFGQRLQERSPGDPPAGQQSPSASETPEERFGRFLAARGINAQECSRGELVSLEMAFQQHEVLQQMQRRTQAAEAQSEEAALRSQWQQDVAAVEKEYPLLANPTLRDAVLNLYEGRHGYQPNVGELRQVATEFFGAVQAVADEEKRRYLQAKEQDAVFPVTAGGTAPAPAPEPVNFHQLSPAEQQEFLESRLTATGKAF